MLWNFQGQAENYQFWVERCYLDLWLNRLDEPLSKYGEKMIFNIKSSKSFWFFFPFRNIGLGSGGKLFLLVFFENFNFELLCFLKLAYANTYCMSPRFLDLPPPLQFYRQHAFYSKSFNTICGRNPSFIYSWSISHILEQDFGRLGSSGQ